jgi:hypothetical protein
MPGEPEIEYITWKHKTLPKSSDNSFTHMYTSSCILNANYTTHIQAALALSWLCAVVRSSDGTGISASGVHIDGEITSNGARNISIKLAPLNPVPPGGTCWHELFPHGIIATNFPIPSRCFGRGLEIPFADMALVCSSLGFVQYKNGLVVDGLNSVLIPREQLLEDNGFQWHFASKIRQGGRVAYTSDLLDALGMDPWENGSSPVVPDDLLNKRCFLAWAEKSYIMVGTEAHFLTTTIGESYAKESASMKYVKAYGLNLGGSASQLTFGGR